MGYHSYLFDFKSLLFYQLAWAASCPKEAFVQLRWIWKRKCVLYTPWWIQMDYFKDHLWSKPLFPYLYQIFINLDTIMVTTNFSAYADWSKTNSKWGTYCTRWNWWITAETNRGRQGTQVVPTWNMSTYFNGKRKLCISKVY